MGVWYIPTANGSYSRVEAASKPAGAVTAEQIYTNPNAQQVIDISRKAQASRGVITTVIPASKSVVNNSVGSPTGGGSSVENSASKLLRTASRILLPVEALASTYSLYNALNDGLTGLSKNFSDLMDVATGKRDPNTGALITPKTPPANSPSVPTSPTIPNQSVPPSDISPSTGKPVPSGGSTSGGSTSVPPASSLPDIDVSLPLFPQSADLSLIGVIAAASDRQFLSNLFLSNVIASLPQISSQQAEIENQKVLDEELKEATESSAKEKAAIEAARIQAINDNSWGHGGFNKQMIQNMTGIAFPVNASVSSSQPLTASASDLKNTSTNDEINRVVAALQAKNLELQNKLLEFRTTPQDVTLVEGEPAVKLSPVEAEYLSNAQNMKHKSDINNEQFEDDDFDFTSLVMPMLSFKGVGSELDAINGLFSTGLSTNPFNLNFDIFGSYTDSKETV